MTVDLGSGIQQSNIGGMMTDLELAELVCGLAAAGETELKAFSAVTKGPTGQKGLKREDFAKRYNQLVASPLLRKLELRMAREGEFKSKLAEAVMLVDPEGEMEAVDIAGLLTKSRETPRQLPALFLAVTKYLPAEKLVELDSYAKKLYPDVFAEPAKSEASGS